MAIKQRTILHAFQTKNTSLAAATRHEFTAITLYNPMTTSRTWRSVIVRVTARADETTAKDMTSRLIGINLAAVGFDDVTVTDTIANTGEHSVYQFERDVTSYFVTNWTTGGSKTCQVAVQFGGVATINITVEIILTFDASDSNATRVKTVQIPLDSSLVPLTAALAEIGGANQIPILTGASGILPEPSPTIRDWYIRLEGNEENPGVNTAYALGLQIDADAEHVSGTFLQNLASSCSFAYIYSRTASVPTTTAVHAFKARSNATATRIGFAAVLVVTYEYDHSTATRALNSVALPMIPLTSKQQAGSGDVTDFQRFQVELMIEEPGTITLLQSGVVAHYGGARVNADWTLSMRAGAQAAFRSYTVPGNGAAWCGSLAVGHRVDAGGAGGAAFTLARGRNVFTFDHYNSITNGSVPQPVLHLNYSSDVHDDGDGAHNHTVVWSMADSGVAAAEMRTATAKAPTLPEDAVWHAHVGFRVPSNVASGFPAAFWQAEVLSGEGQGEGWTSVMGGVHNSMPNNPEYGMFVCAGHGSDVFQRWTGDPQSDRLELQVARRWRLSDGFMPTSCLTMLLTYHSISFRSVTHYALHYPYGDGDQIPASLQDSQTHEALLAGITLAGGTWTPIWFDDTERVYVTFYLSPGYRGRSDDYLSS